MKTTRKEESSMCSSQDEKAFLEVLPKIEKSINYLAFHIKCRTDLPFEDAKQELLLVAWKFFTSYDPKNTSNASLTTWILSNCKYYRYRIIREARREQSKRDKATFSFPIHKNVYSLDFVPKLENILILESLKSTLKNGRRHIIELRLKKMNCIEIGEQLGMSKSMVHVTLKKIVEDWKSLVKTSIL